MGKILAIDFGLKRTGLALSDENKIFAFGLKTIESQLLEKELIYIQNKEKIDNIIIGYPISLNLKDTHITQNVILLKNKLVTLFPDIKIILYDERFTSKIATESLKITGLSQKKAKDKKLIDEVSAVILLQDYLKFIENK